MTLLRPVVGITCKFEPHGANNDPYRIHGNHWLDENYAHAIRASGGLPVMLPNTREPDVWMQYLRMLDAVLFTGGVDVDPGEFGQEPVAQLGQVDPVRDAFELGLCREALELDVPILAICRGVQVLNIAAGGTLVQDIPRSVPDALQHRQQAPTWHPSHGIEVEPNSVLARLLGRTLLRVNSFHHQAIEMVAPGFRATARTSDGVIEAMESQRHKFVVGVQFHPEGMFGFSDPIDALFRGLVEACKGVSE